MICPKCGKEIPEGHLYCDECGTEINFVPEFEPEVENKIKESLTGLANELSKDEKLWLERKKKVKAFFSSVWDKRIIILTVFTCVALITCLLITFAGYNSKSARYYLRLAADAKNSGNMDQAIEYLIRGNKEYPENSDIIFRLSDYYLEVGKNAEAADTLKIITASASFSDEKRLSAYEGIISIYRQEGEYRAITSLLTEEDNEVTRSLRDKYIPEEPDMIPLSGTYDGVINIELNGAEGCSIYYTVNGDDPNNGSIFYENAIVLDEAGEYDIKAVCVNEYGLYSEIVQQSYVVEEGAPAAPEIMEPSGEYNQNTMIVAVAEAGSTIFYTTDGSDPTVESKQYISPITMPVGTSVFKFIAFNQEGESSEIVERQYHLIYTRLVSTEQAVNSIVSTLVRLDILLDSTGKVRGQDGHNEYIYDSVIEIQGAGEYYVVIENHVANDGTVTPTGLMYAVNTHDGSVNRLGYDSSGKYTLITISNR
ncbi:MAG: chitobiase/beta-hexosaminidase C-terminal domain-containing protein [Butyrivibrio sp.]|uniref:chitobiase/beta-hexosaminidase C-terminal domain-containing protein n=1 Tax=Butyrivibrio sp. TaxID=28121 RepID=UPI001B06660C|nr:chitobiase/beta-hexosaminidase C-terminal domain-containing protein [Butyrivibrio sp.]MBO6240813.1 chitobiase/beta-hexosaminidase C-terminal domain-containing protein [Butyrivibrio sp.]